MTAHFLISKPKNMELRKVFSVIHRGKNDVLHYIDNNNLICLVCFEKDKFLLSITDINEYVKVTFLTGNISKCNKSKLCNRLTKFLGLDDPLLLASDGFLNKLNFSFGVPGYMSSYEALVRIVLGQLISAKAADSIRKKFITSFGESVSYNSHEYYSFPLPETILALSEKNLLAAGISKSKSKSILQISKLFIEEDLERTFKTKQGVNINQKLLSIHGVGQWTYDWFMLQELRYFDSVPAGDLVVRKAFSWFFKLPKIATINQVKNLSKKSLYKGSFAYHIMRSYMDQC